MGNVVGFDNLKKWKAEGECTFMLCACGTEDPLAPVVMHDANTCPLIVALMCPACELVFPVESGRVQSAKPIGEQS